MKLHDTELVVQFEKYSNNNKTAITLYEKETGEPYTVATVNVPGLEDNEVAIKDYSENEGVMQALFMAGYISEPLRMQSSGFVSIPICKLLKTE
jgi:hypothetical protein